MFFTNESTEHHPKGKFSVCALVYRRGVETLIAAHAEQQDTDQWLHLMSRLSLVCGGVPASGPALPTRFYELIKL